MKNQPPEEPEMPKTDEASEGFKKPVWNSLEIAKLVVGALTPILIFVYGQKFTSEREKAAEAVEQYAQVIKKRVELWDKLAIGLNDIYCYYLYVGHWKSLSPNDIVSRKRDLDKIVFANRPFFSDKFFEHYQAFMGATFRTFGGWGKDAALRTHQIRPKDEGLDVSSFTDEDNSKQIHERYFALLKFAATELNIHIPEAGSGTPPKTPQTRQDIQTSQP